MGASDLLFRFLRDRSHDLARLSFDDRPLQPFPHPDPHLASSAMQKAVRRGDVEIARRAGHQLLELDRARLWRRIMTLALEDIGIADVTVAVELVAISTLPTARRVLGGDARAVDIALTRACHAVKDRGGDHLASIVSREQIEEDDRRALRHASHNALLAMIASSDLPWTRRLHAAVLASGGDPIQPVALSAVLDVLHEHGAPPLLLVACEAYAMRSRDLLSVFVPFAAMLFSTGCTETVTHALPQAAMIGNWPDYTFDPINTRLGRRAVDLWLRSYLMRPPWLPPQVAAALWNSESAACDRTLLWNMGDLIRQRAHTADLCARGLPVERHADLNAWIARERPHLLCARQAAFDSAARTTAKPAKAILQANLPLHVPERRSKA